MIKNRTVEGTFQRQQSFAHRQSTFHLPHTWQTVTQENFGCLNFLDQGVDAWFTNTLTSSPLPPVISALWPSWLEARQKVLWDPLFLEENAQKA